MDFLRSSLITEKAAKQLQQLQSGLKSILGTFMLLLVDAILNHLIYV